MARKAKPIHFCDCPSHRAINEIAEHRERLVSALRQVNPALPQHFTTNPKLTQGNNFYQARLIIEQLEREANDIVSTN